MMKTLTTIVLSVSLALFTFLNADAASALQSQAGQAMSIESTLKDVSEFKIEIENARQDQLDVLSPGWFTKAEAFFEKAKSGAEKGAALTKINENMLAARENLAKAEETAKLARTMLPEVMDIRNKAQLAGAAKLTTEYVQAENQFKKLTEAIEKNNIKYTQENALKVEKTYRDLELLAIKNETLGKVREVVAKAQENKAEKYAPKALRLAQSSLAETDAFITENRYAIDPMQHKAKAALFLANRAQVLTDQSKKLEMTTPEETSLWMEDVLSKITTWLSANDTRDQGMEDQMENILQTITALKDDNHRVSEQLASTQKELSATTGSYDARIKTLRETLASFESKTILDQKTKERLLAEQAATVRTLEDERKFNQKFSEIQHFFRPDEAEVYKKGNQLIVRLKGMQFPVGTAIIVPENYQLLTKVQRAIGTFEYPSVMIDGHTDSTGSKEMNAVLSQQRADAVKDYLIANKTLSADKIMARGYGSEQPVASNVTAEGRAANRRIDVIVTPASTPLQ